MGISINQQVELNKNCPENEIIKAIASIRYNFNDVTEQEFIDFCTENKNVIIDLVASLIIQNIYDYPYLPNIKEIEENVFRGFRPM